MEKIKVRISGDDEKKGEISEIATTIADPLRQTITQRMIIEEEEDDEDKEDAKAESAASASATSVSATTLKSAMASKSKTTSESPRGASFLPKITSAWAAQPKNSPEAETATASESARGASFLPKITSAWAAQPKNSPEAEREKSESASHLNQIEIIFNESLAEAQQKLAASSDELHTVRHERHELKAALATAKQTELAADVAGQLERSQQLNDDYELRLKHKQAELHKLQAELGQQVEQLTRDLDMLRAQADALGQDNNELREHLDKERTLRAESNANTERIAHQLGSYQIYFTSIELLKIDFWIIGVNEIIEELRQSVFFSNPKFTSKN